MVHLGQNDKWQTTGGHTKPLAQEAAPAQRYLRREPTHLKGPSQMRDQRTNSGMPGRPASKRCAGCRTTKAVEEFYADRRGRLTGRCRDCHRQETRANNRRRHAALRLLISAHLEEYRALLAAQRTGRHGVTSIAGGGPDVA
jgi:hypothetical protein